MSLTFAGSLIMFPKRSIKLFSSIETMKYLLFQNRKQTKTNVLQIWYLSQLFLKLLFYRQTYLEVVECIAVDLDDIIRLYGYPQVFYYRLFITLWNSVLTVSELLVQKRCQVPKHCLNECCDSASMAKKKRKKLLK